MAVERTILAGSERAPLANTLPAGTPDPNQTVRVSVLLRRRAPLPPEGEQVSREDFERLYGADPADVATIEAFAAEFDLTVTNVDLARRTVSLAGTTANMNEAFGTKLQLFQGPNGVFRGRTGHLLIPTNIADATTGVFGLDERPQAHAKLCRYFAGIRPALAADISYTPVQVAQLYNFPAGQGGAGQTIALIELGGGFRASDLSAYFKQIGISPAPSVVSVGVDGVANKPAGDPNSADGEVLLDIEVAGAIAPKAKIVVYFAPNTDQGFLDAITTAIHDKTHQPSVISISWGGPESSWTTQAFTSYDQAFQDAGTLGVTVTVACGDNGSSDGVTDGAAHVDFPASSPHVLACGGTRLESSAAKITAETVWNDGANGGATGGGVSENFPLPSYQSSAHVPVSVNSSHFKGRGVPDVSGDADPATGYQIYVDGHSAVFGGTSAVAPLWAALIALLNAQAGKNAGFVNPALYALTASANALHDITSGTNGAFNAGPGWDACTGLGSPNGSALASALGKTPVVHKPPKKHK